MKILVDNCHGLMTAGKRSPDGLFREAFYNREIARKVVADLLDRNLDAELLAPEDDDIPLAERVRRINAVCLALGKKNVIVVSIHVNAAGNGTKWLNATGWSVYTCVGQTESDKLAECLCEAAIKNFPGRRIRTDMSDGDMDWEKGFYILRKTLCPAVLTENFFMDNKSDLEFIQSRAGKQAVVDTHVEGIVVVIRLRFVNAENPLYLHYKSKNMPPLHIFSFFSGSGFLDLGFETSGYIVDSVNEYSPSFTNAYRYARDKMGIAQPRFGYSKDITDFLSQEGSKQLKENVNTIRNEGGLIGFIGGPPCPDFSIAGKQKGREGDNGKLSQSYTDLIFRQKPDFFLFENVKGLWRTAKHREFFEELKSKLSKYYLLSNRLCNALEYGAPQDRDRILLFGIRKGVAKRLNLTIEDFDWSARLSFDLEEVKGMPWPGAEPFVKEGERNLPEGICKELTAEFWFNKNDVENHPNASDYFTPRAGIVRMQTVQEGDDSKKSYKRIHRWRYSPTVCYGNNEVHLHPYKERRLSASEALALQSLPKEFCLPPDMSLSDKFKTIGNGVPFLLAQGVALTIKDYFYKAK